MYYESYKKKKPRPKRRRGGCLSALGRGIAKLLAWVLVLAILGAVGLYFLPASLFMVEPEYELSLTDGLPSSPFNLLILGVDALSQGGQRSDTIMVASIDREALRLTSIQRDTVAHIEGHGDQKINAAFAYGGAELAMRTVNETFDLNVMKYVVVDFTVLVKLVDALGGIEMDITEAEMEQINQNVIYSAGVFYPMGYVAEPLTQWGESTHLNGLQALGYARIRKLDSDFVRTSRQRAVIDAMLKKLRENWWNPVVLTRFVQEGLSGIQTNLSVLELISLGEKALLSGEILQLRLPVDGSFADDGSKLTITDRDQNIQAFRSFVYGE